MGYEAKQLCIHVSVSRHNSERDIEHDALWDELVRRVDEIVDEDKFAAINAMVV